MYPALPTHSTSGTLLEESYFSANYTEELMANLTATAAMMTAAELASHISTEDFRALKRSTVIVLSDIVAKGSEKLRNFTRSLFSSISPQIDMPGNSIAPNGVLNMGFSMQEAMEAMHPVLPSLDEIPTRNQLAESQEFRALYFIRGAQEFLLHPEAAVADIESSAHAHLLLAKEFALGLPYLAIRDFDSALIISKFLFKNPLPLLRSAIKNKEHELTRVINLMNPQIKELLNPIEKQRLRQILTCRAPSPYEVAALDLLTGTNGKGGRNIETLNEYDSKHTINRAIQFGTSEDLEALLRNNDEFALLYDSSLLKNIPTAVSEKNREALYILLYRNFPTDASKQIQNRRFHAVNALIEIGENPRPSEELLSRFTQAMKETYTRKEYRYHILELAIILDHQPLLRYAIKDGALEAESKSLTPLFNVIMYGTVRSAAILLEHGIKCTRFYLKYALIYKKIEMAELFLDAGALKKDEKYLAAQEELNQSSLADFHKNEDTFDLLNSAEQGSAKLVTAYLNSGADPDNDYLSIYKRFGTPLAGAIINGHIDVVKVLLDHGANPEGKGPKDEKTALMLAFEQGRQDIVELLIRAGANASSVYNNSFLLDEITTSAVAYYKDRFDNQLSLIKKYSDRTHVLGSVFLSLVSIRRSVAPYYFERIIQEVEELPNLIGSILRNLKSKKVELSNSQDLSVVRGFQMLLNSSLILDQVTLSKFPVYISIASCTANLTQLAPYLIQAARTQNISLEGVITDMQNRECVWYRLDETPFYMKFWEDLEGRYLLQTAIAICIAVPVIFAGTDGVDYVRKKYDDRNWPTHTPQDIVQMLPQVLQNPATFRPKDNRLSFTTMRLLAKLGNSERLKEFVKARGITLELRKFDYVPLIIEAAGDKTYGYTITKTLLAAGADINATDRNGGSALHYAVLTENRAVTMFLIEMGINESLRTDSGYTALDYADRLKQEKVS